MEDGGLASDAADGVHVALLELHGHYRAGCQRMTQHFWAGMLRPT